VGSRWCNDECVLLGCSRLWVLDGVMMSVFSPTNYYTQGEHTHHYIIENPQSTTPEANRLIITPSRTHNVLHSRRTHSSLHHREPTIFHTRGEHTHHYTIQNPQSTTLEENTFIITPLSTRNLPHSRRTHSSLHHPVDWGFSMV
jgi:hypothetical protein